MVSASDPTISASAHKLFRAGLAAVETALEAHLVLLIATDDEGQPFMIPNPRVPEETLRVVCSAFADEVWDASKSR
jgi:hypothetical protein